MSEDLKKCPVCHGTGRIERPYIGDWKSISECPECCGEVDEVKENQDK